MIFEKVLERIEHRKGAKLTAHEKMVVSSFFEYRLPTNAEDLWLKMRSEKKSISISTVYTIIRRLNCIFRGLPAGNRMEKFELMPEIICDERESSGL